MSTEEFIGNGVHSDENFFDHSGGTASNAKGMVLLGVFNHHTAGKTKEMETGPVGKASHMVNSPENPNVPAFWGSE